MQKEPEQNEEFEMIEPDKINSIDDTMRMLAAQNMGRFNVLMSYKYCEAQTLSERKMVLDAGYSTLLAIENMLKSCFPKSYFAATEPIHAKLRETDYVPTAKGSLHLCLLDRNPNEFRDLINELYGHICSCSQYVGLSPPDKQEFIIENKDTEKEN